MPQTMIGGRGPDILASHFAMFVLAIVTFGVRVYVHVKLVKKSSAIWLAGTGLSLYIIYSGLTVTAVLHGMGQHARLVSIEDTIFVVKVYWIVQLLYTLSNMAIKLSMSSMLLNLVVEESHKKSIYIATGLMQVCLLAWWVTIAFQCQPVPFFWDRFKGSTDGSCWSMKVTITTLYVYTITSFLFDLFMVVLPWFIVRKMRQSLRTRVMVTFLLSVGSIPCFVTLVRITYIRGLIHATDFLYDYTTFSILACLETGMCIVASNAATFRPLFKRRSSISSAPTPIRASKKTLSSSGLPSWMSTTRTCNTGDARKESIELTVKDVGNLLSEREV